jgi:hypothetical protein
MEGLMLEKSPYSKDAADAADRLRLIKADLKVLEIAIWKWPGDGEEGEALLLMIRRTIGDVEMLNDDILERDKKARQGGAS